MNRVGLILILSALILSFKSNVNSKVRFDGLYQSAPNEINYKQYFRFYSDGSVLYGGYKENADSVKKWLKKESSLKPFEKGKYSISNNTLHISVSAKNGTIIYNGVIKSEFELSLDSKSLINGTGYHYDFYFIKN